MILINVHEVYYYGAYVYVGRQRKVRSFPSSHYNAKRFAIIFTVMKLFLQQFYNSFSRRRKKRGMKWQCMRQLMIHHTHQFPMREVKRSQDIQLTSNEAYGPILRENIQTSVV